MKAILGVYPRNPTLTRKICWRPLFQMQNIFSLRSYSGSSSCGPCFSYCTVFQLGTSQTFLAVPNIFWWYQPFSGGTNQFQSKNKYCRSVLFKSEWLRMRRDVLHLKKMKCGILIGRFCQLLICEGRNSGIFVIFVSKETVRKLRKKHRNWKSEIGYSFSQHFHFSFKFRRYHVLTTWVGIRGFFFGPNDLYRVVQKFVDNKNLQSDLWFDLLS